MDADFSHAQAVFSDAAQFLKSMLNPNAPIYVENDRLIMVAQPGTTTKPLPIRQDKSSVYCGDCYLFDTHEKADACSNWLANDFRLAGTVVLQRPKFLEPTSQLWLIFNQEDFGSVADKQNFMRFERWRLPLTADLNTVRKDWWVKIRQAAIDNGMIGVWLLVGTDSAHPQRGVVVGVARGNPNDAATRDAAEMLSLESMRSLDHGLVAELDGTKMFDPSSWIYMIWHPTNEGESSPYTAQWPVFPPLPGLSTRS